MWKFPDMRGTTMLPFRRQPSWSAVMFCIGKSANRHTALAPPLVTTAFVVSSASVIPFSIASTVLAPW